jgi:glycosyltransferase involved in cell wall biosynthesis
MNSTLYLTRNGLLEPLGQSQVMAYLRGLSDKHSITLITYEKPQDWKDVTAINRARADCNAHGIKWLPQRFVSYPKIIAPLFSMIQMLWLVRSEVIRGDIRLIHARSYIPAAVALIISCITRVPFIFDMRALWPEELIIAGKLRRGSLIHRGIVAAERACLAKSAGVISLTNAAATYLKSVYPIELNNQRLVVIPTCADLDRFKPSPNKHDGPNVHGCIGTVLSGWFRTDLLSNWMNVVAVRDPNARFEIVTRDDALHVRKALDPMNNLAERLSIGSQPPKDMPEALHSHDLSVMFFFNGLSKLGSAPTRLAEVLGCGLPVVANEGVGDVAKIIRENNVGVIIEGENEEDIHMAFDTLQKLMQDTDLSSRCRATAKTIFSLESGTEAYHNIYTEILKSNDSSCVV